MCSPWFYDRFAGSGTLAIVMAACVFSAWSLLGYGSSSPEPGAQDDMNSDSSHRLIAALFNLGALAVVLAWASLALVVSTHCYEQTSYQPT